MFSWSGAIGLNGPSGGIILMLTDWEIILILRKENYTAIMKNILSKHIKTFNYSLEIKFLGGEFL